MNTKYLIAISIVSAFQLSAASEYDNKTDFQYITDITESEYLFVDSDGDSFPDKIEIEIGTDPYDISDNPRTSVLDGEEASVSNEGFATNTCRSGFEKVGSRLCMTKTRSAKPYLQASYDCRTKQSRVATSEDLYYIYIATGQDAHYDPYGKWLGHFIDDDTVLIGNAHIRGISSDPITNFEGKGKKTTYRYYWCAHDLES